MDSALLRVEGGFPDGLRHCGVGMNGVDDLIQGALAADGQSALGDEVRLNIIEALCIASQNGHAEGLNVNEITRQTNLSRPAISHHLKIMKSCGLVEVTQSGTSNYYRLTFMDCTRQLMKLGYLVEEIFSQKP